MKKELISCFLIWTISIVSFGSVNISAQTFSKVLIEDVNTKVSENNISDRKIVNSFPLLRTTVLDTPINFNEINKINSKNLPKRKMSGKTKAMWVAIVIGAAVGMYFLIKYAKECEIYADYCSSDDLSCPCLKYKEKTNE